MSIPKFSPKSYFGLKCLQAQMMDLIMNRQERNLLTALLNGGYTNQRRLAASCGCSRGTVIRAMNGLQEKGYLNKDLTPSSKARTEAAKTSPQNAIILAAGYGMRMVPINMETPKGLLEVNGQPLIERLIEQLQEVGIREIYIVVGFMKEQYEYLIDAYGVELIVNAEYATKNNLHSLNKAIKHLGNSYIIPCDLWCKENPFNLHELYSWYMVSEQLDMDSKVKVNRNRELVAIQRTTPGNRMLGISYLTEVQAARVRERLARFCDNPQYDDLFWEETLYEKCRMIVAAKVVAANEVVEINTYEQLRELDHSSAQLQTEAIAVIAEVMDVSVDEITNIEILKKGMTNRSFLFSCKGSKYIMRIPGEGTDQLINRKEEASVYLQIGGKNICDDVVYINPGNGYKITRYLEGACVCDPFNEADLRKCMKKLHEFHELGLKVNHEFNIFQQIHFYESLWQGEKSVYRDYEKTREEVMALKAYIDQYSLPYVLTHIDAVPDNFLLIKNTEGNEEIRLIDWEYAGMQDPHVDIAMFCIYSLFDRRQVDRLIDIYFENTCTWENRVKIYCYIACCGLLWSNWCEYKRQLGVEFGEYSLRQYRYAKDYYRIVQEELKKWRLQADA